MCWQGGAHAVRLAGRSRPQQAALVSVSCMLAEPLQHHCKPNKLLQLSPASVLTRPPGPPPPRRARGRARCSAPRSPTPQTRTAAWRWQSSTAAGGGGGRVVEGQLRTDNTVLLRGDDGSCTHAACQQQLLLLHTWLRPSWLSSRGASSAPHLKAPLLAAHHHLVQVGVGVRHARGGEAAAGEGAGGVTGGQELPNGGMHAWRCGKAAGPFQLHPKGVLLSHAPALASRKACNAPGHSANSSRATCRTWATGWRPPVRHTGQCARPAGVRRGPGSAGGHPAPAAAGMGRQSGSGWSHKGR